MFIFPLFVFEFIQTKETPLDAPLSIHINVQLDIEKGDDGSIRITSTQPIVRKPPTRQMGFLTSSPAPGATVQVRLNSSSAFGSICAWAQYSTPVYMVKAAGLSAQSISSSSSGSASGRKCGRNLLGLWDHLAMDGWKHGAGGRSFCHRPAKRHRFLVSGSNRLEFRSRRPIHRHRFAIGTMPAVAVFGSDFGDGAEPAATLHSGRRITGISWSSCYFQ